MLLQKELSTMDSTTPSPSSENLVTPQEAGQRLLEGATLQAFRTNGAAGLRPVVVDGRRLFRAADVEGLIRMALAA